MTQRPSITGLLNAVQSGDAAAQHELFTVAYAELRRIAGSQLRRSGGASVSPTTLVHEVYLKYFGHEMRSLEGSAHFYNLMARVMRQVLVDMAKRRNQLKRGSALQQITLSDDIASASVELRDLLVLDEAIGRLERTDPEVAQAFNLHFFAGLSLSDIASLHDASERTIRRRCETARIFITAALSEQS